MITVLPATDEMARRLAGHMGGDTLTEIEATGLTALEAVQYSLDTSLVADAALLDGKVIAMWGLYPRSLLGDRALLWFLDTPDVQARARRELLTLSRYFVDWCQERYPVLECLIDSRHHRALRLVKWLGFSPTGGTVAMQGIQFIGLERQKAS